MAWLQLLAIVAAAPQPPHTSEQARVSIRILRHARISSAEWQSAQRRSERKIRDAQGREFLLRTIDFE
jgi:hypothetical protein